MNPESINISDYKPFLDLNEVIEEPLIITKNELELLPDKIYYPSPDVLIRAEMKDFVEEELLEFIKKLQLELEKLGRKPSVRLITPERYLKTSHKLNTCFLSATLRSPWTRDFCSFVGIGINLKKIVSVSYIVSKFEICVQSAEEFNDGNFEISIIE